MFSKTRARGARVSAAAALAALLASACPAIASAGCPQATLSQPFTQFGDSSWYQLAPAGSFEAGAPGWVAQSGLLGLVQDGASVGAGNESYNLVPGSHSLVIKAGSMAVSPFFCVSSEYPTFRFLARQPGGASASPLNVSLRWVNVLGVGFSVLNLRTAVAAIADAVEHRRKVIICIGLPAVCNPEEPLLGGTSVLWPHWVAAVTAAARANVSVYCLDPTGLNQRASSRGIGLVRLTGGELFTNSNDFVSAAHAIWRDAGRYYLLGYWPSPGRRELHSVDVSVARKDVHLRVRQRRGE